LNLEDIKRLSDKIGVEKAIELAYLVGKDDVYSKQVEELEKERQTKDKELEKLRRSLGFA
jgi:vacuolar-type H+-ATPase subunit I/STV1